MLFNIHTSIVFSVCLLSLQCWPHDTSVWRFIAVTIILHNSPSKETVVHNSSLSFITLLWLGFLSLFGYNSLGFLCLGTIL